MRWICSTYFVHLLAKTFHATASPKWNTKPIKYVLFIRHVPLLLLNRSYHYFSKKGKICTYFNRISRQTINMKHVFIRTVKIFNILMWDRINLGQIGNNLLWIQSSRYQMWWSVSGNRPKCKCDVFIHWISWYYYYM